VSGRSGLTQGPPHVVCDVCGNREVAALGVTPDYVRCEPRDVPPGTLPQGAVRGHHRWALNPAMDDTIRVWCDDEEHHDWLEFSKFTAVAAAKKGGTCRAYPAERV
jgi:hypothetical protein